MLILSDVSMRFGGKILFQNVSLQFNPGNHYGLIGGNGCGKSTLIKIMTGEVIPESGSITIPQLVKLGSLSQNHFIYEKETLLDVVLRGRNALWKAIKEKEKLLLKESFDELECDRLVQLEQTIEQEGGYAAESEAAHLLEGLGIREESHRKSLELLSGGYKLRVLLAQVLFGRPDILVLDEPTNHLDLYSIKWLEEYLRNFPGTVIVTSHDRDFLNGICTHIADVDYGTVKIYKGNYDEFEAQKIAIREQNERMLEKHDKKRADLQGFIDRFGAKATKARQAQSKARLVENIEEEMEAINLAPTSRIYPKLSFVPLRASGIKVLEIKGMDKSYGAKKVLHQVSFEIERGERIAIIGPNGIGKSTLLEILNQHENPDQGNFKWGIATRCAYFPQDHIREVKGTISLLDWLGQFDRDLSQEQLRDLLGRVLFSGNTVHQQVSTLSGGEMARLLLAKMMLQKPNVLIFDEPTNHLDIEAIDELARSLEAYEGTLLLVSHNRYFVSRIANRIIEITLDGVRDFKGTYVEYLEKQQKDYLASQRILSQRYAHEAPSAKKESSQYQDQKKLKSLKSQSKKRVLQLEEACQKIEKEIAEMDALMASDGFYQNVPRDEQQQVHTRKQQLEQQLLIVLNEWELASFDLQKNEELT